MSDEALSKKLYEAMLDGHTGLVDEVLWSGGLDGVDLLHDVDLATLHALLVVPGHHHHQAVAKELQDRADPSTVPVVQQALEMGFDHLAYTGSETAVIAKWHSWVLAGIGTADAIDALRHYAQSSDLDIAAAMQYRLEQLGCRRLPQAALPGLSAEEGDGVDGGGAGAQ